MVRRWRFALAVAGLLAATGAPAAALDLSTDACPFAGSMSAAERARVRCGVLTVPETWDAPGNGRTQSLQVALVDPEVAPAPGTEPVVELHGGPGGGIVSNWRGFLRVQPYGNRTVILLDQRGSGLSQPAICRELGDVVVSTYVRGATARSIIDDRVKAYTACRDRLLGQGFDLASYSTASTVRDLERLREALGLARWNLSGTSYGTAVALGYMRAHPDAVRAVILDSAYPFDRPAFSQVIPNFMQSIDALASVCSRDPVCAVRFGDLRATFLRAVERTVTEPIVMPAGGDPAAADGVFRLSAPAVLAIVHQLLYDAALYPVMPLILDRIAAGDGRAIANLAPQLAARARGMAHATLAAVECHERAPFDPPSAYRTAAGPWPMLRDNMTLIAELATDICPMWGHAAPAPMAMPDQSDIPTLVLAGAIDPITPPQDSRRTAVLLGAAYVELPYAGHGAMRASRCGLSIARSFLDDPQAVLDTRCVGQEMAPAFVTEALRVPAVGALLLRVQRTEPVTLASLGILAVLLVSTVAWPFERFLRKPDHFGRLPEREPANILMRSGLPIALAALTLVVFAVSLGFEVRNVLESAKPTILVLGLPAAAFEIFWLPLLAAALAIWALTGWVREARAGLQSFALWHRAAVIAGVVAVLAWLVSEGLVLPALI